MQSKAQTVAQYLKDLPPDRKAALSKVRAVVKKHLPEGYKETMQYGMITYVVPLKLYPQGYLGKKDVPLPYIALASQKNYMSLYLMNIYQESKTASWFENEYKKSGKKLDMGKSCVRFKSVEDLPLELIAKAVALLSVDEFIKLYEKVRGSKR
jgi:uncharacterized protein YdhG (YjbR/CyaY superfamily)